ncbi:MAG: NUDIX domain-containing protein [Bacteroidetes bacterium]|nr:MAG: NUDIX domain-containing protein [Bacteroidota bacterium]
MIRKSAGILPYRKVKGTFEVFLVHPGGPYWSSKDLNAWSVAKGEPDGDEEIFAAAVREFREETGLDISGEYLELEPVKQPGGKMVYAWAVEYDLDESRVESNLFTMEWPPRSGKTEEFPEVDKAGWFGFETARQKIVKGQVPILDQLEGHLLGRLR